MINSENEKTCPSAIAETGNLLYARVDNGRIERLGTPLPLTADFVAAVRSHGSPEQRFRFAGTCQEGRCAQWTGTGCGVIERVLSRMDTVAGEHPLPRCFLRASCRWFAQEGAAACSACSRVVTDGRAPAGVPQA